MNDLTAVLGLISGDICQILDDLASSDPTASALAAELVDLSILYKSVYDIRAVIIASNLPPDLDSSAEIIVGRIIDLLKSKPAGELIKTGELEQVCSFFDVHDTVKAFARRYRKYFFKEN